jgi:hypothetical protein
MLSLYSCYTKEGLVYVALASPLSWQPSLYLECTKLNVRSSYNIRSSSNIKYIYPITFSNL